MEAPKEYAKKSFTQSKTHLVISDDVTQKFCLKIYFVISTLCDSTAKRSQIGIAIAKRAKNVFI